MPPCLKLMIDTKGDIHHCLMPAQDKRPLQYHWNCFGHMKSYFEACFPKPHPHYFSQNWIKYSIHYLKACLYFSTIFSFSFGSSTQKSLGVTKWEATRQVGHPLFDRRQKDDSLFQINIGKLLLHNNMNLDSHTLDYIRKAQFEWGP